MGPEGTEPENDKTKKLNDEFVDFMRKRSGTEVPRYTARLKTYVDIHRKRNRAARHQEKTAAGPKRKADEEASKGHENADHPGSDNERVSRRRADDKCMSRARGFSRSPSGEPSDKCGRRRRRRRRRSCPRRRRRRRSCRRKRRRRRSCRRKRRRRRSCRRRRSRSRRRKSCCCKRKKRRRRRRC